ncbi:hypothetical protein [Janibacter terrae]|nr:hypothetical protein [Janibacter terrae]
MNRPDLVCTLEFVTDAPLRACLAMVVLLVLALSIDVVGVGV